MHTNEAKTGQTLSANKDPAPPHPPKKHSDGSEVKTHVGGKKKTSFPNYTKIQLFLLQKQKYRVHV